jgi:hypothetical protein
MAKTTTDGNLAHGEERTFVDQIVIGSGLRRPSHGPSDIANEHESEQCDSDTDAIYEDEMTPFRRIWLALCDTQTRQSVAFLKNCSSSISLKGGARDDDERHRQRALTILLEQHMQSVLADAHARQCMTDNDVRDLVGRLRTGWQLLDFK